MHDGKVARPKRWLGVVSSLQECLFLRWSYACWMIILYLLTILALVALLPMSALADEARTLRGSQCGSCGVQAWSGGSPCQAIDFPEQASMIGGPVGAPARDQGPVSNRAACERHGARRHPT